MEFTQLSALPGNVVALQEQQQNDIRQLGSQLAHFCLNSPGEKNLETSFLDKIGNYYSNDLRKVIAATLQHIQTPHRKVDDILSLCHSHTLDILLEQNKYLFLSELCLLTSGTQYDVGTLIH